MPHPHRFIVPVKGVNTFCTFRDGTLVPENPLPHVPIEGHAVDPEFGWVAWIADDGRTICRTHLDAGETERDFPPIAMPEKYAARHLAFRKQVLFVGGRCGPERVGAFDLADPEPGWMPLPAPTEPRLRPGVGGIMVDGDRLVAAPASRHWRPKCTLAWDIADLGQCGTPRAERIPTHRENERVKSFAVGRDWAAVMSYHIPGHAWEHTIDLLEGKTLGYVGGLRAPLRGGWRRDRNETPRDWRQVAFHGNVLLIAAGMDGVGVLDLDTIPEWPAPFIETFPPGWRENGEKFRHECDARFAYQPLLPALQGYAVVRVEPVPDTRHYLAVFDTEPGFDTTVMTLP